MLSDTDRVVIVAEIGINSNGDVNLAKKMIDVAVDAGCDAVKFQKRTIDLVYTKEELDAPRESPWGKTNRDQKLGLEFSKDDYDEIDLYCEQKGIEWFASCWDEESVMFMSRYDVAYHKVASALLTKDKLLAAMRDSGKKVILSMGMSSAAEVNAAVSVLGESLDTVLHCTSTYPTKPDEMNMKVLRSLSSTHSFVDDQRVLCQLDDSVRVGFSNHYSGLLWVPIAVAYGAKMLEFHITLDRTMYGSDQAASIEPDGVKRIVDGTRLTEQMLGDGFKHVYESEIPIRKKLRGC